MKRIALLLPMLALSLCMSAQLPLRALKCEDRIAVEMDYSQVLINGLTIEEFSMTEEDWYKDEPSIFGKFIRTFNKVMKAPVGGRIKNANFSVIVYPLIITDNGDVTCYYEVRDKEDNVIHTSNKIHAKGGAIGSQLNLIGDGMDSLGKKIGANLKSEIAKSVSAARREKKNN